MRWISMLFAAVCFCGLACGSAPAAEVEYPLPEHVAGARGDVTYLDLARRFVPDLEQADGGFVGTRHVALRHLAGEDYDNGGDDAYGFSYISAVHIRADGKERLLVLFDFAQAAPAPQGFAVLALYDVSAEPRLLDAAEIGMGQATYFFDQAVLPISTRSDAALLISTHSNSQQSYAAHAMVMVREDKLQLVDRAFLFSDRGCSGERRQEIRYAAAPAAGDALAPITVTVTQTDVPGGSDCGDEPVLVAAEKKIRVGYRWDEAAGRYVADSDALVRLATENEKRF